MTHDNQTPRPVLFLIDGSSQMYRAYHAIRGLTGPDGRSTNAVYGFVAMLRKLLADHRPELIAARSTWPARRSATALAADYKANRAPMPADLVEQIPCVHEACEALGVPVLTSEGFEADDVIGTLAKRAARRGLRRRHRHRRQGLLPARRRRHPRVQPARRRHLVRRGRRAREVRRARRTQVIDVLALTGDAVDNVKGVPGIGDKGARDLIAQFGSLDALLEGAAEVPQKRYREALLADADAARAEPRAGAIRPDVPVDFETRVAPLPRAGPRGVLRAVLRARLPHAHERLRADGRDRRRATTRSSTTIEARPRRWHAELRAAPAIRRWPAVDVTGDARRVRADSSASPSRAGQRQARYVPLGHHALDEGPNLDRRARVAALRPLLEDAAIEKVGHDVKYDAIVARRATA